MKKFKLLIPLIAFSLPTQAEFLYTLDDKDFGTVITVEDYIAPVSEIINSPILNAEWSNYLNIKNCWENPIEIIENSTLACLSKGINPEDSQYPQGSIGINTFSAVDFSSNQITDLNFLDSVTLFSGIANFSNNSLDNIQGLSNTTLIEGDFSLNNNLDLTDISGLDNLFQVKGDINLTSTNIEDYNSLSNLGFVTGTINVDTPTGNETLPTSGNWCDFKTYNKLGDSTLQAQAALSCNETSLITKASEWSAYLFNYSCGANGTTLHDTATKLDCRNNTLGQGDSTHVFPFGKLGVSELSEIDLINTQLENIDFISGVTRINYRSMRLSSNNKLENIDGLSDVTFYKGSVEISSNPLLSNINGLSGLTSINYGALKINNNANLDNINGLSNLAFVYSNLEIQNNPKLTNINALTSLSRTNLVVKIMNNEKLSDISGLKNLKKIGVYNYPKQLTLLNLTGNNITDYSPLATLDEIASKIEIDPIIENQEYKFPEEGSPWCENQIFLQIENNKEAMNLAAISCGLNNTMINSEGWSEYFAKATNGYRCYNFSAHGDSYFDCDNKGYDSTDENYPYGTLGVVHMTYNMAVSFDNNNFYNLNFLKGLKTIRQYLNISNNPNLSNIEGLSELYAIRGTYHLKMDGTSITDYRPLSNFSDIRAPIILNDLIGDNSEQFPTSGSSWCDNSIYLKITKPEIVAVAQAACGH